MDRRTQTSVYREWNFISPRIPQSANSQFTDQPTNNDNHHSYTYHSFSRKYFHGRAGTNERVARVVCVSPTLRLIHTLARPSGYAPFRFRLLSFSLIRRLLARAVSQLFCHLTQIFLLFLSFFFFSPYISS